MITFHRGVPLVPMNVFEMMAVKDAICRDYDDDYLEYQEVKYNEYKNYIHYIDIPIINAQSLKTIPSVRFANPYLVDENGEIIQFCYHQTLNNDGRMYTASEIISGAVVWYNDSQTELIDFILNVHGSNTDSAKLVRKLLREKLPKLRALGRFILKVSDSNGLINNSFCANVHGNIDGNSMRFNIDITIDRVDADYKRKILKAVEEQIPKYIKINKVDLFIDKDYVNSPMYKVLTCIPEV